MVSNDNPLNVIPQNEWDAIILSIVKPFLPLCARDQLIRVDDLQQEAWLGLLSAARKYDPNRAKFVTFAYTYIRGYIMRYITKATRHKPNQVDEDAAVLDDREFRDDCAENNDTIETIFDLLSDQDHVDLLREHFVRDKSFRQIAREDGTVSHVTVANRVNRLLDVLQMRLSHENA